MKPGSSRGGMPGAVPDPLPYRVNREVEWLKRPWVGLGLAHRQGPDLRRAAAGLRRSAYTQLLKGDASRDSFIRCTKVRFLFEEGSLGPLSIPRIEVGTPAL